MKKRKLPIIITSAVVLVAAIAAIFLYPYLACRTIGSIYKNELSDVVRIEMTNGDYGGTAETDDPEEIKYIIDLISDIKVKKRFYQGRLDGSGLSMTFVKANGDKASVTYTGDINLNDTRYLFDEKYKDKALEISDEIQAKYSLGRYSDAEE